MATHTLTHPVFLYRDLARRVLVCMRTIQLLIMQLPKSCEIFFCISVLFKSYKISDIPGTKTFVLYVPFKLVSRLVPDLVNVVNTKKMHSHQNFHDHVANTGGKINAISIRRFRCNIAVLHRR